MVRRALVPYIASLRGGTQSQGSGGIREGSQGGSRTQEPFPGRTRLPQWNLPHVSLAARTRASSAIADGAAGGCRRPGSPPGLPAQPDHRRTEGMRRGGRAAEFVDSQEHDQPPLRRGAAAVPPRSRLVAVGAVIEVEGGPHVHQPDRVWDPLAYHYGVVPIVAGVAGGAVRISHTTGAPAGRVATQLRGKPGSVSAARRLRLLSEAAASSKADPGQSISPAPASGSARDRASVESRCPPARVATLFVTSPKAHRRADPRLRAPGHPA